MDAQARPRLLTFGDLLLDVLVAGDFSREYDSAGAVSYSPAGGGELAVGAAAAGRTRFVARVGDDAAGTLLLADLRARPSRPRSASCRARRRVRCSCCATAQRRARRACGRIRRVGHAGARGLRAGLVPRPRRHSLYRLLLVAARPRPAAYHALAAARAASPGLLCSLDPNPGHLIADYGPDAFRAMVAALRFDLLLPNAEEGRLLAGAGDPATIVTRLLDLAPLVALTLGAEGCLLAWGAERRHVPAPTLAPVDATGAGDAFAAGFVTAYCRSRDPVRAAEAGTAAAARVVMRPGAR